MRRRLFGLAAVLALVAPPAAHAQAPERHVARKAVTASDVWFYDAPAKRVLAGDLVTFPVPFRDSTCPDGWVDALATIDAVDFTSLTPGRGAAMTHADFSLWKQGLEDFVDCAAADLRPMETCAGGWLAGARHFLSEQEVARIAGSAFDFGELVRSGKLAANC